MEECVDEPALWASTSLGFGNKLQAKMGAKKSQQNPWFLELMPVLA